jgi:hypothetical protein
MGADNASGGFEIIENLWIPLADGCRLAARMWLPSGADQEPVPAVLEYLPYRKRDGTADRDEINHPYFACHGYACVRVDLRGNGESDGFMEDEYTPRELADGCEVIAWIAAQPWCTGAVGMMGISWGGFNGLQIAALRPPALAAVITVCSTDDRYGDDIHYMGGCLLNDNMTWSQQMLSYSSRPPDPMLVGSRWRGMWLDRLRRMPLLAVNWLRHQRRDDFWRHGSVGEDYSRIEAPVLAVGGWADAYSNAVPRLLEGLQAPRKGIIGPWEHKYPHLARVGPGTDFLGMALRWWDHWLRGDDNEVMELPDLSVYLLDFARPSVKLGPRPGRWIGLRQWPFAQIRRTELRIGDLGLTEKPGPASPTLVSTPQHLGQACGYFCAGMRIDEELPGDQRDDDALSVTFDTQPLKRELVLMGAPRLQIRFSSDKPVSLLAVRLCAVAPDGGSERITWRPANLTHWHSDAEPALLEPGRCYDMEIVLNDIGYAVPPGHRLRLAFSTSYWPMLWPSPETAAVTLYPEACSLSLPVLADSGSGLEIHPPPVPRYPQPGGVILRPPSSWQRGHTRPADGVVVFETCDDYGETRDPGHGLEVGSEVRQRFSIHPDDPLSAEAWAGWTHTLGRGEWRVRTETWTRMTSDREHFRIEARLEAYDDGQRVFAKDWNELVARDHN